MTDRLIRRSVEAIRVLHETITLPADLLIGIPPEHPKVVRTLWTLFTGILAALFVVVLSLPIPSAKAQRGVAPDEMRRHLEEANAGFQRLTTIEQQLSFANERIREMHVEVDSCRKTIQELKLDLAVMNSTIWWIKTIAASVLASFVAAGGLMARKIWKVK